MEKNFDRLEVGRTYLNGRGEEVKIIHKLIHSPYGYDFFDTDIKAYTNEGSYLKDQESNLDLIRVLPLRGSETKVNSATKRAAIEAAKRAVDPIVAVGLLTEDEGNALFDSLVDLIEDTLSN